MSATWQLWLGALLLSFAPVFVKWMTHLGPTTIGFYRCAVAAVLLLPFVRRGPAPVPSSTHRRFWGLVLAAGLVFAIDLFVWHRSVLYAGAGIGTILGNTQVFYLGALGLLFFGERVSSRFLTAIALAVVGTFLLVDPVIPSEAGDLYWRGVGYGLATGVVYAGYVIILRALQHLQPRAPLPLLLMAVSASTAAWLLPVATIEGTLVWPALADWPALLCLSGVVQVGGWFLITRNLPRVPVSRVGLLLLTQPVGATIWGMVLFGEQLGLAQMIGAVMTVLALYLGSTRGER